MRDPSGKIVCVLVVFSVVQRLHQLCGSVAQVQRYRLGRGFLHIRGGLGPCGVDGIRLGRESEVDRRLGKREFALG